MNLYSELIQKLRSLKLTLGFAESCTGGLLSSRVTAMPGVSDVFMGSVITYSNQMKVDLLNISRDLLNRDGAVSESVALQMAEGCCQNLGVACAAAITGVAGPSGGSTEKPVGTVWIAVCGLHLDKRFLLAQKFLFQGNRLQIQSQSADQAALMLLEQLRTK